jgi:hypothetical protein
VQVALSIVPVSCTHYYLGMPLLLLVTVLRIYYVSNPAACLIENQLQHKATCNMYW